MEDLKEKKKSVGTDDYSFDSETSSLISAAIAGKKEAAAKAKSRHKKKIIITASVATAAALAAVYFGGWAASMGTFLPNTYINGVDVSKKNISEAAALVQAECVPTGITVIQRNGEEKVFSPSDFDYTYDVFGEVSEIYRSISHSGWLFSYFKESYYETDAKPSYDENKLKRLLTRTSWGSTATEDAKLVHGENGYYIKNEVYGDIPDEAKLAEYVLSEAAKGNFTVDLEEGDCYEVPKIFASDLGVDLDDLNNKFNYVITYDFGYATEELTGATVYEWMEDGGTINRAKAEEFVNSLADKYDTFMSVRNFETTKRGTITLNQVRYSTGQYGWWTDREKTVEKLLEYIDTGESVTVEPEYVTLESGYTYRGYGPGRSAEGDIGDTYIEVDLSAQHMWYYQNGELKFETGQIVSGKASDPSRKTPEGVYSVYSKSTNYTMKAADGSYTAKCAYFMRVSFEGIGFHDLSRSAYGGNIYLTNGSHGCIN
ncbi:MAG: L,D-transpeptidase family protein, partial [Huintestinicola sp.]